MKKIYKIEVILDEKIHLAIHFAKRRDALMYVKKDAMNIIGMFNFTINTDEYVKAIYTIGNFGKAKTDTMLCLGDLFFKCKRNYAITTEIIQ